MKIACPHCQQRLELDEGWQGASIDCPACGQSLTVPHLQEPASGPDKPAAGPKLRTASGRPRGAPNLRKASTRPGMAPPRPSLASTRRNKGGLPGIVKFFLFVATAAVAAFAVAMVVYKEPPHQVWKRLIGGRPEPAEQAEAPPQVVTLTPDAAPPPAATAAPTPTPPTAVTPGATPLDIPAKPDPTEWQPAPTPAEPAGRADVPADYVAAPDRVLVFGTRDAGVSKTIPAWGLDTAWLDPVNVRRGVIFMGKPQVDVIRFSFTPDAPLVRGDLDPGRQKEFDERMSIVNTYTKPSTALYFNLDGEYDPWFKDSNGEIRADRYAQLIDVTRQKAERARRKVLSIAPFNEPDYTASPGTIDKLREICGKLRSGSYRMKFRSIRLCGASTLNCDQANVWYEPLKDVLDEGNTHQLAGSFDNYAAFYQNVRANGDIGANDELHNIMEAMVGSEYGMQVGIWWGPAERARGEFVKASDGKRLAYAEHRPNWTAAGVYRGPDGKVQAFVSESERQCLPTVYRFFSKDRNVFYDGHGPRRDHTVTTTGGPGYWTPAHRNAETVVNVTWGDDVQPVVDGRYLIVNRASGKVLEVADADFADGAPLQQSHGSSGEHQQWDVTPLPRDAGGDYSYFTLRAVHSGKLADESGFSFEDGNPIKQFGMEGNVVRHWYLEYAGDHFFRIHSRWSGKCLAPLNRSKGDRAPIVQVTPDGKAIEQQWRLIPADADVEFDAPAAPAGLTAAAGPVAVTLKWTENREPDLASYTILRAISSRGPFEIVARGVSATTYTDGSANQRIPYFYTVKAVDRSLNVSSSSTTASATPTGAPAAVAEYAFEGSTDDSTPNLNHAGWVGDAAYEAGPAGKAIALDGESNYVTLPPEVANFDQITVAAWVDWDGGAPWQRIFDFGNGPSQFLFLTPKADTGMRFVIKNGRAEQKIDAKPLPIGRWTHVAVTLGSRGARLYVDGKPAASSPIRIKPSDFRPAANSIGRSQFDTDPLFAGKIDDFRIYNHELTAGEIATLAAGPER